MTLPVRADNSSETLPVKNARLARHILCKFVSANIAMRCTLRKARCKCRLARAPHPCRRVRVDLSNDPTFKFSGLCHSHHIHSERPVFGIARSAAMVSSQDSRVSRADGYRDAVVVCQASVWPAAPSAKHEVISLRESMVAL